MRVGIESINAFVGGAAIDVADIFRARSLNMSRFENLLMTQKSVSFPWEDPITLAVNAAKPIVDALSEAERRRIEVIVTASESGLDFGKSMSTYVHAHLGLDRRCKVFEVKQACFGGTAGLGIAIGHVIAHASSAPKVLVIATDVARPPENGSYVEPSQGAGAVAFLVSAEPHVLEVDVGASGYQSYEVMDTCRPDVNVETGDPDLSLFSYLDCLERCFEAYGERVDGADLMTTFDKLVFHTPFGGMVKGAHRRLVRKVAGLDRDAIEADYVRRVAPTLTHGKRVGNLYSASLYLALASLLDEATFEVPTRIGLYSYGSGCSSEFFSGVVGPSANAIQRGMHLVERLDGRYRLAWDEYEVINQANRGLAFGVKDVEIDLSPFARGFEQCFAGRGRLVLKAIRNYHREYVWV